MVLKGGFVCLQTLVFLGLCTKMFKLRADDEIMCL